MKIFGWSLSREEKALQTVNGSGGWWPLIAEPYPGAWQNNDEESLESVLSYGPVFACATLIASDIAKLRVKLVAQDSDGIWAETKNAAFSPVLRKPNHFQTRIQFFENWVLSKLSRGNAYVLKQRDNRSVVTGFYVLNPDRVTPLVSDNGDVFYRLRKDNLSRQAEDDVIVPAREIIHDRFNCLYHPLVGLSPIHACAVAAGQGLRIQRTSSTFFANGARPSGVLTAPGEIKQETADRLKAYWDTNFSGANAAKVAVLGDGLKYEAMTMTSTDAQLIEQLKWSAEMICMAFHVPPYKIGVGQQPAYNNIQALNVEYYSQCLQILIESIEECLDEGMGIGWDKAIGTEFDQDNLLRMDAATQMDVIEKSKNVLTLDERRRKLEAPKITGGDTVYLQQQDHSIEAIAARDALLIEQAENGPIEPTLPAPEPDNDDEAADAERAQRRAANKALLEKRVRELVNA